jgi:hypothetical protein
LKNKMKSWYAQGSHMLNLFKSHSLLTPILVY